MRRLRPVAAIAALALAGLAVMATPAGAALRAAAVSSPTLEPSLVVRRIDTTAFPTVKIDAQVLGRSVAPSQYSVKEGGTTIAGVQGQTVAQAGRPVGTVLVIDTAASMNDNQKLIQAKAAAKRFVAQKQANDLVAVVSAGPVARVAANFTADSGQLDAIIDGLGGIGDMALYDGLRVASALFNDRPELLANIIAIVDRHDSLSKTTGGQALAAERSSKAMVFTVGMPGDATFDASILRALATDGGQYLQVSPSQLPLAVDTVQKALQTGVELTYASQATAGSVDLSIAASGLRASAHTVPGAVASGSSITPATVHLRTAPGPLKDKAGELLIALLALVAAALLAYGILSLTSSGAGRLETALLPYRGRGAPAPEESDETQSFAQTALVARAVEATARIAEQQGILDRVEARLEQADLALRPAEAIFFYLVAVVIVVVALTALKGLLFGFFGLVIAGLFPPALLSFLASRRLRRFTSQLPDTLQLLASSLRAGFSFLQGVEAVANESPKPMGDELRRVIIESRLGRPLEEALQDCADRMRSPDFDWAVMAVRIQREVGGNLAELLQTVSETMIERERLRRDVKALTAEGRVSAVVLGILPPALGLLFYVSNPTYMKVLFTHTGGQIALAVATVVAIGGFLWMKKIVDIEV